MLNPNAKSFVPSFLQPGAQPVVQGPPQVAAPVQAAPVQPAVLPVPNAVVAYSSNFDSKHVDAALDASSAVAKGKTRAANVKYSTVFKQDYIEGLALAEAAGKGTGNYQFSVPCHQAPPGTFALAERTNKGWKSIPIPMFFCKVLYKVAVGVGGARTVTLYHLETDF